MITNDMMFGAEVGWRIAHDEICELGQRCSHHQPIGAEAQRGRLVGALVEAVLSDRHGLVVSAVLTRAVIDSLADELAATGRAKLAELRKTLDEAESKPE